jgi:serine/threonine-protein kinase
MPMSGAEEHVKRKPPFTGPEPTADMPGPRLEAGTQIGHFRIESEIGRGGAGVVYLAQDTKLDRHVAVKSLPLELMRDAHVRSRLKREARLLASLDHPNIATIHDIVEHEESGGYLILEYIAGDTLAERISQRPLDLREALSVAQQITDAVAAAHEHGVTHRDLKPGNIKITPDGKVKVLDFGLAKAVASEATDQKSTITEPGRVIGTPAYMCPEQARGQQTDKRCDIWSFGCVLYEMLTGKVPFKGETISDTLANVLQTEPDWHVLPQSTPANIQVLLRRCLEKDPRRRLRDIGDASIEINEAMSSLTVTVPTVDRPHAVRLRRLVVEVVFLLLAVVVTSLTTWNLKPSSTSPRKEVRHIPFRPEMILGQEALWHHALALSLDGRRLAYVGEDSAGRRMLYLCKLDEDEKERLLPGTESAVSPFFSPDGEWVGFGDHFEKKFKIVSIKSGETIPLGECLHFRGGSWMDDTIIFSPSINVGLCRVSPTGGQVDQLTIAEEDELGHWWPQILPGGKAVLFTNARDGGLEEFQIEIYSLETGERQLLFKGGTYAKYIPTTGHIVYARKETLYAIRFDIERLKVVGSRVVVVPDVITSDLSLSGSAQFAAASDGTLAYVPVQTRSAELRPVWVDRDGQFKPVPEAPTGSYRTVAVSPDGSQVAFNVVVGGKPDVWIYNQTLGTTRLTSNGDSEIPIWHPDGERIIYGSSGRKWQFFLKGADGRSEAELLTELEVYGWLTSCSRDSKLLITRHDSGSKLEQDICVVSLEGGGVDQLEPFIQRDNMQREGVWSPDGRWVAYSSDETRWWEVYVESYPGHDQKVRISTEGGTQPVWSRDGKELFYRCGNKMMAASIETDPELKVASSEFLFEDRYLKFGPYHNYDVAPDGRFLMIQESEEPTPPCIHLVLNWSEELKRLAPVKQN